MTAETACMNLGQFFPEVALSWVSSRQSGLILELGSSVKWTNYNSTTVTRYFLMDEFSDQTCLASQLGRAESKLFKTFK
jgi:hypothetical protein